MEVKLIGDFISMDNDKEYVMMRKEKVLSVNLFPPSDNGIRFTDKWRLQVSGEGYIVFEFDTRDEAMIFSNKISTLLV